jgi:hypothetical protein
MPPVKSVAEFVQILLQMSLGKTVMSPLYEGSQITDEGMHMRQNEMSLAFFDRFTVVDIAMSLKRWIHRKPISSYC